MELPGKTKIRQRRGGRQPQGAPEAANERSRRDDEKSVEERGDKNKHIQQDEHKDAAKNRRMPGGPDVALLRKTKIRRRRGSRQPQGAPAAAGEVSKGDGKRSVGKREGKKTHKFEKEHKKWHKHRGRGHVMRHTAKNRRCRREPDVALLGKTRIRRGRGGRQPQGALEASKGASRGNVEKFVGKSDYKHKLACQSEHEKRDEDRRREHKVNGAKIRLCRQGPDVVVPRKTKIRRRRVGRHPQGALEAARELIAQVRERSVRESREDHKSQHKDWYKVRCRQLLTVARRSKSSFCRRGSQAVLPRKTRIRRRRGGRHPQEALEVARDLFTGRD